MSPLFTTFIDPYIQQSWEKLPGSYQIKEDRIHIELHYPFQHHKKQLKKALLAHLKQQQSPIQNISLSCKIQKHQTQKHLPHIKNISNIIGISSNKGGVGKSTIATNIAIALAETGARVGLADLDLYGPNQPQILGHNEKATITDTHYEPVTRHNLATMSMGYLVEKDQALVWRGPMVSAYMQQLITKTQWPKLDYLILDLPPGTGDIHLSLCQKIPLNGMVMVTTPQKLSLDDCQKGHRMLQNLDIHTLGVITNMDGYTCTHCHTHNRLFHEDAKKWANALQLDHFGALPLDPDMALSTSLGEPFLIQHPNHPISEQLRKISIHTVAKLSLRPKKPRGTFPKIVIE